MGLPRSYRLIPQVYYKYHNNCPPNLKSREISRNDPNKIQGEIKAKKPQISPCILLGSFREISRDFARFQIWRTIVVIFVVIALALPQYKYITSTLIILIYLRKALPSQIGGFSVPELGPLSSKKKVESPPWCCIPGILTCFTT